ncbi:TPA: hypothetical protein JA361_06915 [Legionella pneumophila]|nr:hypothetical protein [Legionella pneumophila]HAT8181650.1 hypothetical protein [Legionella pneumophila]
MSKEIKKNLQNNNSAFVYLRSTGLATNSLSSILHYTTRIIVLTESAGIALGILGVFFSVIGFVSSTIARILDPTASKFSRVMSAGILIAAAAGAIPLIYLGMLFPAMWVYLGTGIMGFGVLNASYYFYLDVRKENALINQYKDNPEQYVESIKEKRQAKYEKLLNTRLDDKQARVLLVFKLYQLDKKLAFAKQEGLIRLYDIACHRKRTRSLERFIDLGTSLTSLIVGVSGLFLGIAAWPIGPILLGISLAVFSVSLLKSAIQFYRKVNKNNALLKEVLSNDRYISLIDANMDNHYDIEETDPVEKTQEKVCTYELSQESALSKDQEHKEHYTKLFQPVNKTALRPNDEETDELSCKSLNCIQAAIGR